MSIVAQASELIKQFEGFRSHAYVDAVGVWTIGYGTTSINGQPIPHNLVIQPIQAESYLDARIIEIESQLKQLVRVPLTDNQTAALISFIYNVGYGDFKGSTLLRDLNDRDYAGAAHQLVFQDANGVYHGWVHGAHGEVIPGLVTRRQKEKELFLCLA